MDSMEFVHEKKDLEEIKKMINTNVESTGSDLRQKILQNLQEYVPLLKKIVPNDYKKMLNAISSFEKKGLSYEQAELEAFYKIRKK